RPGRVWQLPRGAEVSASVRHMRVVALAGLLAFQVVGVSPMVRADDLTSAQQKQDNANRTLTQAQQQERQLKNQQAQTQSRLDTLRAKIGAKEQHHAARTARLDAPLGQVDAAQRQLDSKKADLAQTQDMLKKRA